MRRRPEHRADYPTEWRQLTAADAPRSGAAAPRPHSRFRPARWRGWNRSFAGYFGFAHVAEVQPSDDVVAEIRGTADGIERLDIHLLANDLDPHLIVRRGAGDHAGFDAEALAQQLDAAPGGDRIVGRQRHRGQGRFDVRLAQNRLHTIRPQQPVAKFEHYYIRLTAGHFRENGTGQRRSAFLGRGHDA